MAGAASGLFVAANVGSSIAALTSQGFLLIMMLAGAIGFYLGIDTPPLPFHSSNGQTSNSGSRTGIDAAEFLSAVGTFFAAFAAGLYSWLLQRRLLGQVTGAPRWKLRASL
jgi:hypothetical protein